MLTTITPYWGRPEMLRPWLAALRQATLPQVNHFIYFVGEPLPAWWAQEAPANALALMREEAPGASIGHYHNLGAITARTKWIMKLDVDAFPNVNYFAELLRILDTAKEREWFNGGMFYMSRMFSYLLRDELPATSADGYQAVMVNRRTYAATSFLGPAASNFICRKHEYLQIGGCDRRFQGWGWEDYQQLYTLERNQRQADPLPGPVDLQSVTTRCRNEISRPKAAELLARSPWLCLLHKWHAPTVNTAYRSPKNTENNRRILLEHVTQGRKV